MELFAAAGIDLPPAGSKGRALRSLPRLRVPLLNYKVVEAARARSAFAPTAEQKKAASDYARKARTPKFATLKETAVRPLFIQDILQKVLGYRPINPEAPYTLDQETAIRFGAVDVAIGRFNEPNVNDRVVAPFELKGPGFADLDRIVPGRGRSPVQQAWDYAIDTPGAQWVLVSNCIEIRLYGFGRGRDAYELFDCTRLDDPEELTRLWLVLSETNLLGGATERVLRESDGAYKDVTDDLYRHYKGMRARLIAFLTGAPEGPKLATLDAIEPAQKILDRILFIAFAQRTGLLPDRLLQDAAAANNKFSPTPIWTNFVNLFRYVDSGRPYLDIAAYNGGLFAQDEIVDDVVLPDELAKDISALGEWDYRREVPVTVLGHLFEQSITDIETLKAESRGLQPPSVSKRKREGVVYTPDLVTRFLVERTIGLTLDERREALWRAHDLDGATEARPPPADREIAFWSDYLTALRSLTVVDPACGSGAFLVAAFDELARRYRAAQARLSELGVEPEFDAYDEIVTKNLYGVDLNPESVEITRLSLWLKTARRDHRLQNLEATIKCGNSLVDDRALTDRPFDWRAAYPHIFVNGGFDIVIGNPPYVRANLLAPLKFYLKEKYSVYDGSADLYCYFYEKSFDICHAGSRIGFVTSGSFFKATFGQLLREYLVKNSIFEVGVDFMDSRVFEGVTTYPVALVLSAGKVEREYHWRFLEQNVVPTSDLGRLFQIASFPYPSLRMERKRWHCEIEGVWRIRNKIEIKTTKTLADYSIPVSGIKTGLTSVFVVPDNLAAVLVASSSVSRELLRPWATGDDLSRWASEPSGSSLIFLPKGWTHDKYGKLSELEAWAVFSREYPAIADWLSQHKEKLRNRSDKGDYWWELRSCDYYEMFDRDFIVYPEMSQGRKFLLNESGNILNNKCFMIDISDDSILAYLNSKAAWFMLKGICSALRGGEWRLELRADYLKDLPLPDFAEPDKLSLAAASSACTIAARERVVVHSAVRHRILDLAPPDRRKLTEKLDKWHTLDFASFRAAIKTAFRVEIPVRERGDWEAYLAESAARVNDLTARIEAAEREIDAVVYRLFDLDAGDIAVLEASIAG